MCGPLKPWGESDLQYRMFLSKMRTYRNFVEFSGMKALNCSLCFHNGSGKEIGVDCGMS